MLTEARLRLLLATLGCVGAFSVVAIVRSPARRVVVPSLSVSRALSACELFAQVDAVARVRVEDWGAVRDITFTGFASRDFTDVKVSVLESFRGDLAGEATLYVGGPIAAQGNFESGVIQRGGEAIVAVIYRDGLPVVVNQGYLSRISSDTESFAGVIGGWAISPSSVIDILSGKTLCPKLEMPAPVAPYVVPVIVSDDAGSLADLVWDGGS